MRLNYIKIYFLRWYQILLLPILVSTPVRFGVMNLNISLEVIYVSCVRDTILFSNMIFIQDFMYLFQLSIILVFLLFTFF